MSIDAPSTPEISLEGRSQMQATWDEHLKELNTVIDGLGMPMDEHIKEIVVGLNLNGIATDSSCGGHPDSLGLPYIGGTATNQPRYRYIDQEEIERCLVEKYHLDDVRDIYDEGPMEKEYFDLIDTKEETSEYQAWYPKNDILREKVVHLIDEFNSTRPVPRIHLSPIYPGFRIEGHNRKTVDNGNEELRISEIYESQKEFQLFMEFLKKRYLSGVK